ncbi:MAG: hemolysin family protein [Rickettsiales bacterium]
MPEGDINFNHNQSKTFSTMLTKLTSFFKVKSQQNNNSTKDAEEFSISQEDSTLLDYQNLKAEDIMIPRTDIVAINYKDSLSDISKIFLKARHTRMPVYKEELDNIIGFINIKDILPFIIQEDNKEVFVIDKVIRKLLIISPSMKILNLLDKMRQTKTHIALVVDEFGGTDGLITIEDLVEEIIGDIEDEHDQEKQEQQLKKIDDHTFEANGRIEIEDLEEKLNLKLTDPEYEEGYDTLGGLILSISNSIPNIGDKITQSTTNVVFEIIDSDPRRIKKVLIHLPK